MNHENPYIAKGFTDAEINEILCAHGESASVARSASEYTPVSQGRDVIILGRAEVVVQGKKLLAVDEEGVWHRDCLVQRITDGGTVDGVELVRANGRIGA
jgi:hypothetical protein